MKLSVGTVPTWRAEFGDVFEGKKVMVTGASGFIGTHLWEALVALGAEAHGFSWSSAGDELPPGERHRWGDIRELDEVRNALRETRPQLIYHLAAMVTSASDVELVLPMLQTNLLGTVHLLLAASEVGCERIVIASSAEEPDHGVEAEGARSPYAASKAGASIYARMFHRLYGVPVVLARLFFAFGPLQEPHKLVPYTIRSLLSGEAPRLISGERVCDFIFVTDVVRGLLKAGVKPDLEGRVVGLGTGVGTRIKDMAAMLVSLMGSAVDPVVVSPGDPAGQRPAVANLDASKEMLDWQPVWDLRQGLRQTIAWCRAELEGNDDQG